MVKYTIHTCHGCNTHEISPTGAIIENTDLIALLTRFP